MRSRRRPLAGLAARLALCAVLLAPAPPPTHAQAPSAAPFVVIEARGTALKPGQRLSSDSSIDLQEGERLRVLGLDGRIIELRGPRTGPLAAPSQVATAVDRSQALSALITNRNARIGTAGLVRAGPAPSAVPDAWSIDISRPGTRCVREGERPILWHPAPHDARISVLRAADRSWRADIGWSQGQSRLLLPELMPADRPSILIIGSDRGEYAINLLIVPAALDDALLVAGWMLDRGCLQQADALLNELTAAASNPDARRVP